MDVDETRGGAGGLGAQGAAAGSGVQEATWWVGLVWGAGAYVFMESCFYRGGVGVEMAGVVRRGSERGVGVRKAGAVKR